MVETIELIWEFWPILRDDPRIGYALVVIALAGLIAAFLIRRFRRDEFLEIRMNRE